MTNSIRYKSETIKLSLHEKHIIGRTNICETHLKNKQVLYLTIDGRERFKEALNQIVFFNLSILIIWKITCGWAHIWLDSRFLVCSRRFYLTRDMTNLYPFIQALLEWPFSELISADVSLWNQYKYIAFNIFSCRILIISYKILIITGISNEKTNELTKYGILCWNVTIFYQRELASLFQVQEKLKACRISKLNFLSSYFIVNYGHIKVVWLHVAVFSEHDVLHFWDNVHLLKYYHVKVPQNCFNYFNCSNQTCYYQVKVPQNCCNYFNYSNQTCLQVSEF